MAKKGNKESNKELKEIYVLINNLIRERKIKFEYYNSTIPLELLEICENKLDNTIELKFRDIFKDYIDEFKKISNSGIDKWYKKSKMNLDKVIYKCYHIGKKFEK